MYVNHVTALESQFARLAAMETEFHDLSKLAILIPTLKGHDEFKALIASEGVRKDDTQT